MTPVDKTTALERVVWWGHRFGSGARAHYTTIEVSLTVGGGRLTPEGGAVTGNDQ